MSKQESALPKKNNAESYTNYMMQAMKAELQKYNPTLRNVLKIEQIMAKYKEFDSKNQLSKKLDVSMRPPVLNVILKYLEKSNKLLLNQDGSITWIYANAKAIESWKKAEKL